MPALARRIDRQTDRQNRQTEGRQTDRQTDRQKDIWQLERLYADTGGIVTIPRERQPVSPKVTRT